MKKGEAAPFDGQLLSTELAIKLAQKADGCDERIRIEADKAEGLCKVEARRQLDHCYNDLEAALKENKLLRKELEEGEPWYRSPVFVAVTAFAATVATVYVVGRVTR